MDTLSILSNVNMDMLKQLLGREYKVELPSGYGNILGELLDPRSTFHVNKSDFALIHIDGLELLRNCTSYNDGKKNMDELLSALENEIQESEECLYIISNIDISIKRILPVKSRCYERDLEAYWYDRVCKLQEQYTNIVVYDFKNNVEIYGRNLLYSSKMWYMGSIPYSLEGLKIISEEIEIIINSYKGKRKKCLAIDLDNTLWGGVIGEDGIEGIKLSETKEGAIYYNLQKRIKELKNLGIILIILSKNNFNDVEEVFLNHPHMVLKQDDFVCSAINWEDKSFNLKRMIEKINIGLDSVVFLDDNPVEREMMLQCLSKENIIEFPKDITQLETTFIDYCQKNFKIFVKTEEDNRKTSIYKEEFKRKEAVNSYKTFDEYIKSLDLKIKFHEIQESEKERVAQLTQKTNQFNVTSQRYCVGDLEKMLKAGDKIYTIHVKDRFGDNGLVSVVILKKIDDNSVFLDTFLMSCRVMGRKIEYAIINKLQEELKKQGYLTIYAEYRKTPKNTPVNCLFEKLEFIFLEEKQDTKKYKKDIGEILKDEYVTYEE